MKSSNLYGYTSGWCLECPKIKGLHYTIQFLQVLLLRCTFSFAAKHQQGISLDRKCVIWRNGIFWGTPDGVEVLVEIVEQNTIVIVLIRCLKGHEMFAVKLRADVIHEIHAVQAKWCPHLGVEEYMTNPSSLVKFEESQYVPMLYQDKICITEIANSISNGHPCVQDVKSRPLHINNHLLHFEPYAVIGKNPKLLDCLFDPDHTTKEIPSQIIYEYADLAHNAGATPYQIGCIMNISRSEIEEIQISERDKFFRLFGSGSKSYRNLRELFDSYSIFRGRNPLVS